MGCGGVCPQSRVCLASGEESQAQEWAFTYLDGQHPDGKGSGQVDVGFEGVEDHCVTALRGKDQK